MSENSSITRDTNPAPSVRDGEEVDHPEVDAELEIAARSLAAFKIASADPTGSKLPDDVWRQAIPEALAVLSASRFASAPVPDQSGVGGDVGELESLSRGAAMSSCASSHSSCACNLFGWEGASQLCKERYGAAYDAIAHALAQLQAERDSLRIRLQEAERATEAMREACAKLVAEHQEWSSLTSNRRGISERMPGNMVGLAYADAIRSLATPLPENQSQNTGGKDGR